VTLIFGQSDVVTAVKYRESMFVKSDDDVDGGD
jgi:hypothetical protein